MAQRDATIGRPFPDPYYQPPEPSYDPNRETFAFWRLQDRYQAALKAGQTMEAEKLIQQIAVKQEEMDRRDAESKAKNKATAPPSPKQLQVEKVEEGKLETQLAALAKQAAGLEKEKTKLLRGLVDSRDPNDFQPVNAVEAQLTNIKHQAEAVQLRLGEIEHNRERRRRADKDAAYWAEKQRQEEALKKHIKELEGMVEEAARHWQAVRGGIAAIRAKSASLPGKERDERAWLDKVIEATGALEVPHGVGGLRPAICWQLPEAKAAQAAPSNNSNPRHRAKRVRANRRRK
jgi:hypothetical protein